MLADFSMQIVRFLKCSLNFLEIMKLSRLLSKDHELKLENVLKFSWEFTENSTEILHWELCESYNDCSEHYALLEGLEIPC